jgi:hypothetical protein
VFEEERRHLLGEILYLRSVLHEHGIEVDDDGASEFFAANRRMVAAASEFMAAADGLRAAYGTSKELLRPLR